MLIIFHLHHISTIWFLISRGCSISRSTISSSFSFNYYLYKTLRRDVIENGTQKFQWFLLQAHTLIDSEPDRWCHLIAIVLVFYSHLFDAVHSCTYCIAILKQLQTISLWQHSQMHLLGSTSQPTSIAHF